MSDKVDELREKLRNDRQTDRTDKLPEPSGTGEDTLGYIADEFTEDGHSILNDARPIKRSGTGNSGSADSKGQSGNRPRRFTQINFRERPTDRRSSENSSKSRPDGINLSASPTVSGTADSITTEEIKLGNLYTNDPIPKRNFTEPPANAETKTTVEKSETKGDTSARKRGRPAKQRILSLIKDAEEEQPKSRAIRKEQNTLTVSEAEELREPLTAAIKDAFVYIDQALWAHSKDPLKQPIWSDVTEDELSVIVKMMLKGGLRSSAGATTVRAIVNGSDYITTIMVLGPRLNETAKILMPDKGRKRANNIR